MKIWKCVWLLQFRSLLNILMFKNITNIPLPFSVFFRLKSHWFWSVQKILITSVLFTENLSENGQTDQYRNIDTSNCPFCASGRAVDGDNGTCMRTEDIGTTSFYDKKTWWYVDLGGVYNLYNIRILFKDYPGYSKYVCPFVETVYFSSVQSKANLYITFLC